MSIPIRWLANVNWGIRDLLREDTMLLLLIINVAAWSSVAAALAGGGAIISLSIYSSMAVSIVILFSGSWVVVYGLYTILWVRPKFPVRFMAKAFWRWFTRFGSVRVLILIMAFSLFFSVSASLKNLIPAFHPYYLDPALAHWDAALYGGHEPWRLLQPLLGHPLITAAINFLYNIWYFLMVGLLLWQIIDTRDPQLRQTFLRTFVAIWVIIGAILASFFASVGPAFYGKLMPHVVNPYADLMAYLQAANEQYSIWAYSTQDYLWELYTKSQLGIGVGLSAMPSMHISMAWLMYLIVKTVRPWLGWLMLAYVAVLMVGSVHLAWHYSLDGYVSIITTSVLWWLVKRWVATDTSAGPSSTTH